MELIAFVKNTTYLLDLVFIYLLIEGELFWKRIETWSLNSSRDPMLNISLRLLHSIFG